ncbi:hypothetical protein AFLA_005767 [Aspergillus flavus NRRL3357]|nr:hypothetical protein AFLA_005767 [Aspergillus flavus NRRL3357]
MPYRPTLGLNPVVERPDSLGAHLALALHGFPVCMLSDGHGCAAANQNRATLDRGDADLPIGLPSHFPLG